MFALADYQLRCGAVVVGGVAWTRRDTHARAIWACPSGYVYQWADSAVWWWGAPGITARGPLSERDGAMEIVATRGRQP